MARFRIDYAPTAIEHLAAIRAFDRQRIVDELEADLEDDPAASQGRRKRLDGLVPPWEAVPPIWQLRVGDYRVFYEVDESEGVVTIRAVRRKGGKTTKEIL